MSLEQTLAKVEKDIDEGDLGKARDRLHGLIVSYPNKIFLRKELGGIYWRLQLPEMAGRYWYLEENKDDVMLKACQRFECKFQKDPMLLLFAIKFKGDLEAIKQSYAGQTLLELHHKAIDKHHWYKDFRNRGKARYHQFGEDDPGKYKTSEMILKWVFVIVTTLVIFLICVGVVSVVQWFF